MGGLAKGGYQIIIYKKLWFATKEEFKESHLKEPDSHNLIVGDLYLDSGNLNLQTLVDAIGLDEKGAYDFAVPQAWFDEHLPEWTNNWTMRAIWFYPNPPEPYHLLGELLRIYKMFEMLKDQILQEGFELWKKQLIRD
ncbi:hypothetical protein AUJ64_02500 [Candidatus Pacearchaeota archaeon CG1_02_39_14]|nr:MAG: hypothetical protein AUJ64_02500 [Candidatus Pacearchaeota archaeon CG1_02_39_14]